MSSDALSTFFPASLSRIFPARSTDSQSPIVTLTPKFPNTSQKTQLAVSQTAPGPDSLSRRIKRKPPPLFLELPFTSAEAALEDRPPAQTFEMFLPFPDSRPRRASATFITRRSFLPTAPNIFHSGPYDFSELWGVKPRAGAPHLPDSRTRPRSFTSPEAFSVLKGPTSPPRSPQSFRVQRLQTAPAGSSDSSTVVDYASPPPPSHHLGGFGPNTHTLVDSPRILDEWEDTPAPIFPLSLSAAKRGFVKIVIPRRRSIDRPPLGSYDHISGGLTCDSVVSFDFPLPPPTISFPDLNLDTSFEQSTLDALARAGTDSDSELEFSTAPTSPRTSVLDMGSCSSGCLDTKEALPSSPQLARDRPLPPLPPPSPPPATISRIRFEHPPASDAIFKENRLPTPEQLERAAGLTVLSETGAKVPFFSLWKDQKTVVLFIRHFWCPMCQDYMFSISRSVSAAALRRAGVQLVIISNGSFKMIPSYRKIFKTPFAVYTDPSLEVYNAMGMTIQSLAKGTRPSYIKHGMAGGIGMVVGNALKSGMPLFEEGGDIAQLGGEFIMGPGLSCSFAHRMRYTRAHKNILDIIAEAGVDMFAHIEIQRDTGKLLLAMSEEEEARWMRGRCKQLEDLTVRKAQRRGGDRYCDSRACSAIALPEVGEGAHLSESSSASACSSGGTALTSGGLDPYSYLRSECSGAYVTGNSRCSTASSDKINSLSAASIRSWMNRSTTTVTTEMMGSTASLGTVRQGDEDAFA